MAEEIGEKGKLYTEELQWKEREKQNCHLNTTVVITAGRIHQWMLKRKSESLRRKIGWSHGLKVSSPKYLLIALLVLTCTCVHKFFDASPSGRCSWIPLFPVSVGWTWVALILPNGRGKVVISRWRSPACVTFATGRVYITYLCIPRYWWEEEGPPPLPYSCLKPWSQPLRREHETCPEGHSTGPSDQCFLRLSSRCSSISVVSYNVNFLALISKVLTLGEVYENSLYYCCHFSRSLKACQNVT